MADRIGRLPAADPNGGLMNFVSTQMALFGTARSFMSRTMAQNLDTVSPGVSFGDNFAGMDFVNTTSVLLLTNDATNTRTLYKTVDGGSTWTIAGK